LELCPLNPLKDLQYRFMEMLVAKSKGLFAKVSRSETSGTLGCGHWAQLAKATNAQCVTPFKRLQNADGRIDKSRVFLKDPRFEKMCTEGWKVYKLPFAVQAAWPELPAFIQRALNASNLAVSHPNELETQRTLVEYMQHMDQYSDANWQTACDAVAQTSICKDYMDPVMVLVREHAGGAQCPRLWEATDFQRQIGATARLGRQFCAALAVDAGVEPFSHLRWAIAQAQITSSAVTDGVYDFISSSSVSTKLKSDLLKTKRQQAERALQEVNNGLFIADVSKVLALEEISAANGAFRVRDVLWMFGIGKAGFEGIDYKSLDAIKATYARKIDAMVAAV
jgi:hypothetical protein